VKTTEEVIAELRGLGLLGVAERAARMPLDRALKLGGARRTSSEGTALAAALRAIELSDPARWTPSEIATLTGLHRSWVGRLLARGRVVLVVHLEANGDPPWTACGFLPPELGRGVAVPERLADEANCPVCVGLWRTGNPIPRGLVHVRAEGGAEDELPRAWCGLVLVPGASRAVPPLWGAAVSCEACRGGPR
jgi:hypothetical protein